MSSRSIIRGVAWLSVQSIAARLIVLISQIVLARILVPSDFGLLGLATTVTAYFSALATLGLDVVLQSRQAKVAQWAGAALFVSIGGIAILALACAPAAYYAARLYHDARLIPLILIAASAIPFLTCTVIPQVILQRQGAFRFISVYGSVETLSVQCAIVGLACIGGGPYSFVLPLPFAACIRCVVFWLRAPTSIRWAHTVRNARILVTRGGASLGWRACGTAIDQGDYFVLGMMANASAVGLYSFAFRLVAQPTRLLASNTISALVPALVALKKKPAEQREAAVRASELLGLVTALLCAWQAALCAPFFHFVFHHKWDGAIAPLQMLSIGLPFEAMALPASGLLDAQGRFLTGFRYQLLAVPALYAVAVAGVYGDGVIGLAAAVSAFYASRGILFVAYVYRGGGVAYSELISAIIVPLTIGMLSFVIPVLLQPESDDPLRDLAVRAVAAAVISGLGVYVGARDTLDALLRRLRHRESEFG